MNEINGKIGNRTEENIAIFFKNKGYWAFIIPKSVKGQPFDIIARRENDVWFVDAKHLEEGKASFTFDRIEPNQITSMMYAKNVALINDKMGFIIEWDRSKNGVYSFLPFSTFLEMKKNGLNSVKIKNLQTMDELI